MTRPNPICTTLKAALSLCPLPYRFPSPRPMSALSAPVWFAVFDFPLRSITQDLLTFSSTMRALNKHGAGCRIVEAAVPCCEDITTGRRDALIVTFCFLSMVCIYALGFKFRKRTHVDWSCTVALKRPQGTYSGVVSYPDERLCLVEST